MATITYSASVGAFLVEVAGLTFRKATIEEARDAARMFGAKMILRVEAE